MREALRMLEVRRGQVVLAVFMGVLAQGSALALAALAAWLIVRAWQMPPVLDLSVAVVSVRALGISRGLFRYLERLVSHDVAFRGATAARVGIYRELASGDPGVVTSMRRGDLVTRSGSDVDEISAVVVRAVVPIVVAVTVCTAAVVLVGTISVTAAAILAASLIVAGVVAPVLSTRASDDAERATMADRTDFTDHAVVALEHAAELRVAGRAADVVVAAGNAARRAANAEDRVAAKSAFAAAATPLAVAVSLLGAVLVGIALAGDPTVTPMSTAILVLLPLSAFEAVAPLPAAARALTRACAAARHVRAKRRQDNVLRAHAPEAHGPGCRTAVVGPSGSGKTTLLMSMAGLLPAGATMTPGVTFFAEDAHLFDTSVLENLRVARGNVTEGEAVTVLRRVGLGEWLDGLADGVHTGLVGGAAAVSGGQRRRLLLARALLSPARVLLLDEPTEHLDAEQGAQLLCELLDRDSGLVAPDRGVVVVTHQLPDDHHADQVLRVERNSVAELVRAN